MSPTLTARSAACRRSAGDNKAALDLLNSRWASVEAQLITLKKQVTVTTR
ncbi:hypothetical protein [Actinoplanes sp. NPDC051494]